MLLPHKHPPLYTFTSFFTCILSYPRFPGQDAGFWGVSFDGFSFCMVAAVAAGLRVRMVMPSRRPAWEDGSTRNGFGAEGNVGVKRMKTVGWWKCIVHGLCIGGVRFAGTE